MAQGGVGMGRGEMAALMRHGVDVGLDEEQIGHIHSESTTD